MIRGPYKRYLRNPDPLSSIPRSTLYDTNRSRSRLEAEAGEFDGSSSSEESSSQDLLTEETLSRTSGTNVDDTDMCDDSFSMCEDLMSEGDSMRNSDTESTVSEMSDDERSFIDTEEHTNKHDRIEDSTPLYSGSSFTTDVTLVMILMFSLRHSLSYEAISDLLRLIKTLCPNPNGIPKSFWCFRKHIKASCTILPKSCAYCSQCFDNLSDPSVLMCPTCNSENKPQSFTILPIDNQISSLFKRKGFYDALEYRFTRCLQHRNNIEDIYDGDVYKCLAQGILSSKNNISLRHNTDGISVFRSSGKDIWPIFLQINELSPHMRKSPENMILAGIWFGSSHPPINTFMKPIKDSLLSLETSGINVNLGHSSICVKAILLTGVYDIPAKSDVLGFGSHRGPYACTKCLHPGEVIRTQRGANLRVYPNAKQTNTIDYSMRTHENIISDASQAVESGSSVHGVQELSIMSCFPHFDFVQNVAIDAMHGLYGGVTKALIALWFDSSNHSNPWYLGPSLLKEADSRLMSIRPPSNISKTQRSLKDRKYWKASEYQYFFQFYLLPCLEDLLPQRYFHHVTKLVTACYLLNKDSINQADLNEGERLINEFHFDFIQLYGKRHATLNLHYLLHLPQMVRELGPLWANTCYEFESSNSVLKKLLHGTQKVDMQIAESIAFVHFVHSKMSAAGDEMLHQCYFLKRRLDKCRVVVDNMGMPISAVPSIVKQLFKHDVGKLSSREYTRSNKIFDFAVFLSLDDQFYCGLIEKFVVLGSIRAVVSLLDNNYMELTPHIRKYSQPISRFSQVEVSLNQIKQKCMFLDVNTGYFYIALIPKHFSSD